MGVVNVVHIVLQPGQVAHITYATPEVVEPAALTLEQVSIRYATSLKVLRRLISTGKLPAANAGRRYTVRIADAERLFAPKAHTSPTDDVDAAFAAQLQAKGARVTGGSR